jgi:hypothetical protein
VVKTLDQVFRFTKLYNAHNFNPDCFCQVIFFGENNYEVWRKTNRTDKIKRQRCIGTKTSFKVIFSTATADPNALFSLLPPPPVRRHEVLFGDGPQHPILSLWEGLLRHREARKLCLPFGKQKMAYRHLIQKIRRLQYGLDVHRRQTVL